MTTIQFERKLTRHVGRSFYFVMALVLAAIVLFGFSHTVPGDFATPGFPPLLVVHGLVFLTWVVLFVAQPALVVRGSLALHRRLGWFGAGLAVLMVVMGYGAVLLALRSGSVPSFYPHGLFLCRGFLGVALFAGLLAAGVVRRREADWHKRLMLCASIIVIGPGLERALPLPLFGAQWPFVADGLTDLLLLAGPAVDLVVRHRVHPAYLWALASVVTTQIATDLLAPSAVTASVLKALGAPA